MRTDQQPARRPARQTKPNRAAVNRAAQRGHTPSPACPGWSDGCPRPGRPDGHHGKHAQDNNTTHLLHSIPYRFCSYRHTAIAKVSCRFSVIIGSIRGGKESGDCPGSASPSFRRDPGRPCPPKHSGPPPHTHDGCKHTTKSPRAAAANRGPDGSKRLATGCGSQPGASMPISAIRMDRCIEELSGLCSDPRHTPANECSARA